MIKKVWIAMAVLFGISALLFSFMFISNSEVSAGAEKWVEAMPFCTEGMVKDVKEEITSPKSEFHGHCKKAGKRKATDARCKNGKLELKCN